MSLTDYDIRLLSAYSDGEATPSEARETEALLEASSDARAWLSDARTLRSVSQRASDEAMRRLNHTLPLTGESIVAAAGGWKGWGRAPLIATTAGVLALGALLIGERAFDGSEPATNESVTVASSTTPSLSDAPSSTIEGTVDKAIAPVELIEEPVAASAPVSTRRVKRGHRMYAGGAALKSSPVTTPASPATWQEIAQQPFALDMDVRIILSSSSGLIIVNDSFLAEPIHEVRLDKREDLLEVTTTITMMVDSLNASIGRIATDRTQPAEERVRRIMIEQLRYREGIKLMIDKVQSDTNTTTPDSREGASNDTLKDDDSLMNIDPALYSPERPLLPCPLSENCSGVS